MPVTTCSSNNEFASGGQASVCGGTGVRLAGVCCAKWKRWGLGRGKKFFQRQRRCGQWPSSAVISLARRPSGWFVRALIRGKRDPRVCPQRRGIAGELRHLGAKTAPSLARTASALPDETHVVVWLATSRKIHDPFPVAHHQSSLTGHALPSIELRPDAPLRCRCHRHGRRHGHGQAQH